MLYNDKFVASLPPPVPFKNPWVVAICNFENHTETRKLIEKWYENLPEAVKPNFREKLLSVEDNIFVPAFHELSIYRFCQEEGWQIQYEPQLENGLTPDLVVDTKQWGHITIEVTTVFDSDEIKLGEKRKELLSQKLSLIQTEKVLEVTYNGYPIPEYKPAKAAEKVKEWLDSFGDDEHKSKEFELHGCSFIIKTVDDIYKPRHGCVFAESSGVRDVPNYTDRIKKKLNHKRMKYSSKNINMPLIVVVADGVGQARVDEYAVDKALFGQHTVTIYRNSDKPGQWGRDRSGHFTPSNDEKGDWFGKNTGISGVLYSSYNGGGKFHMQLFNNPFAKHPTPFEPFKIIPQLITVEQKPHLTLKWAVNEPSNFIDEPGNTSVIFE